MSKDIIDKTNDDALLDKSLEVFDINSIPMSVLDKAWVYYAPFFNSVNVNKIDENDGYHESSDPDNGK